MIIDRLENASKYYCLGSEIEKALKFLADTNLSSLAAGRHELGNGSYVSVSEYTSKRPEESLPEYHEKYLDVQFLVTGREKLGFTPDTGNYEVAERYDERDLIFVKDVENEGFITSTPGCFCVFFPTDIHRPQVADGDPMRVRKVVVKASV